MSTSPIIRPHIGLAVRDVDASVAFYTTLFGVEPVKRRDGYAKFSLTQPSLNLSLNQATAPRGDDGVSHFGIEVVDTRAVSDMRAGLIARGGSIDRDEENVSCCYAVQDKFWVTDPDGNAWEVFTVKGDSDQRSPTTAEEERSCCAPECCA